MSGHGWVIPNPDGLKARCGGPALCRVCQEEERLGRTLTSQEEKGLFERSREKPFAEAVGNTVTFRGQKGGEVEVGPARDGFWVSFMGEPTLATEIADLVNSRMGLKKAEKA